MLFDIEDRCFDTPTVDSAMSWREQVLLVGADPPAARARGPLRAAALVRARCRGRGARNALRSRPSCLREAQVPAPETGRPLHLRPAARRSRSAGMPAPTRRCRTRTAAPSRRSRRSIRGTGCRTRAATRSTSSRRRTPAPRSTTRPALECRPMPVRRIRRRRPTPDPRVDDLLAAAARRAAVREPRRSRAGRSRAGRSRGPGRAGGGAGDRSTAELLADGGADRARGGAGAAADPDPPNPAPRSPRGRPCSEAR